MENAPLILFALAAFIVAMTCSVWHIVTALEFTSESDSRVEGIILLAFAVLTLAAGLVILKSLSDLDFYHEVVGLGIVNTVYSTIGATVRLYFSIRSRKKATVLSTSFSLWTVLVGSIALNAAIVWSFSLPIVSTPSAKFWKVFQQRMPPGTQVLQFQVTGNRIDGNVFWIHFISKRGQLARLVGDDGPKGNGVANHTK
jgi:hypothetical protein